ncbi:MAG: hypothetical protein ACOY90_01970 [Candidatus Zhuqueibacterota bacterium]
MKEKAIKASCFIFLEIFCLLTIGYFVLGYPIFDTNSTGFTFKIFGLTAIILFNLLEFRKIRDFFYIGILISFILILTWFNHSSAKIVIRNSFWFIAIGLFMFITWKILNTRLFKNLKFGSIFIWIFSFICIYFLMTLLNIYIFGYYKITHNVSILSYLSQAFI